MFTSAAPFIENVEIAKELKPEELVREKLEFGLPLSPNDLAVYAVLVVKSPRYLGEKSPMEMDSAKKLLKGWKDIIEVKYNSGKFPGEGWRVMTEKEGWKEFPKTFGPWGEGLSYGLDAVRFCRDRADELMTGAVDRVPGEDVNISKHVESLRYTADLVVAPENNF